MWIEELSYVQFISLLQETNRPPGGKHTVRYWITNAHISSRSRVLEIGCNTGFTSLELCRSIQCEVVGVDISEEALSVARKELLCDVGKIQRRVNFERSDVRALPFQNATFDVVICGGALSFVQELGQALSEIKRVLTPWGFLCVSPLCYRENPPDTLRNKLWTILGFEVPILSGKDWIDLVSRAGFEIYASKSLSLSPRLKKEVYEYVDNLVYKTELELNDEERLAVWDRALKTYLLFNQNHQYLEAALGVFRKRHLPEERELFGVKDWI